MKASETAQLLEIIQENETLEENVIPIIEGKILKFRGLMRELEKTVNVSKEMKDDLKQCVDKCVECTRALDDQKSKKPDSGRGSDRGPF